MMNMQNMMRQAQKLQKQMEQSQAELAAMQFVGKSDMTVQAINSALEQIDETTKKKLGAFAGKLPF